eukprot:CAMPEP_0171096268 /NCGR_PEP_ID=MMETSP0766_2-20121228/44089_1 /TAXON_ID=439317 /ORGANISM="Gambierdiscus australes, Strain CAWD 149" /LENGTH=49 /DNA_ID=CAMNT_0011555209 /DNA_START=77 /DNA_END=226 /DNA_ORIENTATION=-
MACHLLERQNCGCTRRPNAATAAIHCCRLPTAARGATAAGEGCERMQVV